MKILNQIESMLCEFCEDFHWIIKYRLNQIKKVLKSKLPCSLLLAHSMLLFTFDCKFKSDVGHFC